MPHETTLIATVAVGFVLAFIFGFLADRFRLPPLVGYLIAGIFLGPFTPGFVADPSLSGQLAEVGVILLMFGVGLHFSISDLMAVKWIAIPGAIGQIVLATLLGVGVGTIWGWSLGGSLVFGLSLSVASTVVLLKALEERNMLPTANGRIAVGWLIVEDLAMVVALVLLPAFAETLGGHAASGHGAEAAADGSLAITLGITLAKVVGFVVLAIALGPRVVPWILGQVARTGSRELFTLSVLAVALGIAYGSAVIFGVSFALGAFFAGVVLSESRFSHRAAHDSLPLQDAFAVLFFVSVGMLFDPSILVREPLAVLAVLAIIMVGKSLAAMLIVLVLGYPLTTAVTVAASLAQVGEFSFILAGLGAALGLLPKEGSDLILAGALLSITLNPLAFVVAPGLIRRLSAWSALARHGEHRYRALEADLEAAQARAQEREHAHVLEVQQVVQRFPIFADIDPEQRQEFLLLFKPRSANPGERIIQKGDKPDGMYFISSGKAAVDTDAGEVALGPGDFFGEMALLSGSRRTADVTALDYCELLTMSRRDFLQFLARNPGLRQRFTETASQRSEVNRRGHAEPSPTGMA
ncbi:cation:proton antiporter domain-containing protein [Chelatococcus asaccharovorans]|uniref:cation:proton antiporter domain-containing protein n=1 Tax=Chelatococcus asaccharovorans TaxID=28210 RepID=UPI00224C6397|nr:cation:proton antiporter [Chelatococcus asaccharovorans]CAH1650611.1 Kef-type potassium/proton antiporter (CPA2 family) [Chelatococcus asaccharovorans]CAH1692403.1 Kef-type potassium/proton antiporter (CPA2 family) [Chelatococcus asaccharovorans]